MKYKLTKTYPGSHELGTVVEGDKKCNFLYSRNGRQLCVLNSHVEKYPEYWEEVNQNLWWVVFTEEDTIFESYYPYCFETSLFKAQDSRQYFKTKEEADEFIFNNKPYLSYKDIAGYLSSAQRDVIINLIKKL